MDNGEIFRELKTMSAEDQRTFDRWLYANATFGAIFAAGLIAMAVASFTAGPLETTAATKAPDIGVAAAAQRPEQTGSIR